MRLWTYFVTAIRRDPWTKLLAIGLACMVWYVTNVRERDAERVIDLPVLTRRVPRNLVVTEWPLDRAVVTVRGPGPLLDGIDERRTRLVVSCGAIEAGENVIDLKTARIEPELPSSLSLVRVQPGRATLVAAPVKKRTLPVRPATVGKPAPGYRIARIEVEPDRVEASGPAEAVDKLEELGTAVVRIDGASAPIATRAFVEWAGDLVTFVPDRVLVRVEIEEISVTRRFDNVSIDVRGVRRFRIDPSTVSLTLRAPAHVLDGFELPEAAVYIDASALEPGEHQVAVTVALPPAIEVVSRRPEVHRIVVEKEKAE